jgi:acetyl-CoA carboxylase beta subunit
MAAEDRARRVDIGFAGGQVLALRLRESVYKDLQKALESDKSARWHELKTEDSDLTVDLAQVVYVRIDTEEHKVGF